MWRGEGDIHDTVVVDESCSDLGGENKKGFGGWDLQRLEAPSQHVQHLTHWWPI